MRNVEFDPGDGWREVDPAPSREQRLALITNGVIDRMWARESPVPPLPTEPDTVIRTGPIRGMKCGLYTHPPRSHPRSTHMKYRKKPVEVDAIQFDGTAQSASDIQEWAATATRPTPIYPTRALAWDYDLGAWILPTGKAVFAPYGQDSLLIPTVMPSREGWVYAGPDDWVIQGTEGEFYPCKPTIFEATYEAVDA